MSSGIRLHIPDRDQHYLGVELRAWNERFAATTFLFTGLEQLSGLAAVIEGYRPGADAEALYGAQACGSRAPRVARAPRTAPHL